MIQNWRWNVLRVAFFADVLVHMLAHMSCSGSCNRHSPKEARTKAGGDTEILVGGFSFEKRVLGEEAFDIEVIKPITAKACMWHGQSQLGGRVPTP
ncbi:hypothetical protein VNO77_04416 [Canavalia gladiata]|uniref:Secreted protein n=1 Tax=Canavalia gladiata TaxID=3824 RepID=A0AAN9MYI8_CANGL